MANPYGKRTDLYGRHGGSLGGLWGVSPGRGLRCFWKLGRSKGPRIGGIGLIS